MMKKLAIFIPSYNTATTISSVLDRIPKNIVTRAAEIFILDNDSSDGTLKVASDYKKRKKFGKLTLISNGKNIGYGGSQKKAYQRSIDRNYDIVVMLHSDAQYPPEMIPALIRPIEEGNADAVFGSRISTALRGRMPIWRYLGNRSLTLLQNFIMGTHFTEFHSAFRAYNVHALARIPFRNGSNTYHIDTDLLVLFKAFNLKIAEIPIPTHYGSESQSPSLMKTVHYSINVLSSVINYKLHRWGIKRSKLFA